MSKIVYVVAEADAQVVHLARSHEKVGINEVAEKLHCSSKWAATVLKRCEKIGLLRRLPSDEPRWHTAERQAPALAGVVEYVRQHAGAGNKEISRVFGFTITRAHNIAAKLAGLGVVRIEKRDGVNALFYVRPLPRYVVKMPMARAKSYYECTPLGKESIVMPYSRVQPPAIRNIAGKKQSIAPWLTGIVSNKVTPASE
jgi:Mn-dependent DtxR family transcriptional regulator